MTLIAQNKKVSFEYHILDRVEAGIVLNGDEVKAMRAGHCALVDSFARMDNGSATLYKMNIPEYKSSCSFKSDPVRDRVLLMHKREIIKLYDKTKTKGITIVPTKIYFNDKGHIKVELALCQGKKQYDKRDAKKEADVKREIARNLKI